MMSDTTRATQRRAECRDACPLTQSGHCGSHGGMIAVSRWLIGIVIALLLAVLGAVSITRDSVAALGQQIAPQLATVATTSARNFETLRDLGNRIGELERRRHDE